MTHFALLATPPGSCHRDDVHDWLEKTLDRYRDHPRLTPSRVYEQCGPGGYQAIDESRGAELPTDDDVSRNRGDGATARARPDEDRRVEDGGAAGSGASAVSTRDPDGRLDDWAVGGRYPHVLRVRPGTDPADLLEPSARDPLRVNGCRRAGLDVAALRAAAVRDTGRRTARWQDRIRCPALLTTTGEWVQRAGHGSRDKGAYQDRVDRYLDELPRSTWLVICDIHH